MKKNFILVLPIFALTLSGCNEIESPKFKKYSNEVSYQDFLQEVTGKKFDEFFTFESSMEGSAKTTIQSEEKTYSYGRLESDVITTSKKDYSFKYDSVNQRSNFNEKEEVVTTFQGFGGSRQSANLLKASRQYQMHTFDDEEEEGKTVDKLISIDKAQKAYYLETETGSVANLAAYKSMSGLLVFSIYISLYSLLEPEVRESIRFYNDNSILSVYSYSEIQRGNKDSDNNVISITKETTETIFQLELTKEKKVVFRYSDISTTEITYLVDTSKHYKNDTELKKNINYQTSKFEIKDLTINEIDVSDYAFRDKDLEDI